MRLAIVNLTGGGLSGGYRKYLKNTLPRFANHNEVDALLCVTPEGNDISGWFDKGIAIEYCMCSSLTLSHFVYAPDRKMAEHLKKFSPDIIFLPVDRYIRFNGVPVVNMVRNMEPFVPNLKGDTLQERLKKVIQRRLTCKSVRLADHTIAVSGFVKDYLTAILHVQEGKVSQVYHGLVSPSNESCKRPSLVPIGWDEGFLFTCGSIRPARGLEDAIEALNDLKKRNLNMRLVIAGETTPAMRKYRNGLERLLSSKSLAGSVCWAGNLNDEEIRWCYDRCSFFVMTSRIEACPNIAMEAMSYGAISVVADNAPLPEFFSDCAAYYEARNGRSLAESILSLMGLDSVKQRIISERSRKRSKMFSWDLTADKTVDILTQVLKRSETKGRYSL
jgi:glycosyltransferase involved in cell wall biosynthesis